MSTHAPTSRRILPARVRFAEDVVRPLEFDGLVPVSRLPRLCGMMPTKAVDALPPVTVRLWAGRAEDGGVQLHGRLRGYLNLRCERCLQPMEWLFDFEMTLRLVHNEADERRLLDHCEPLLLEDDWLPLHQLVEDEILLALPMAPAHFRGDCPPASGNR